MLLTRKKKLADFNKIWTFGPGTSMAMNVMKSMKRKTRSRLHYARYSKVWTIMYMHLEGWLHKYLLLYSNFMFKQTTGKLFSTEIEVIIRLPTFSRLTCWSMIMGKNLFGLNFMRKKSTNEIISKLSYSFYYYYFLKKNFWLDSSNWIQLNSVESNKNEISLESSFFLIILLCNFYQIIEWTKHYVQSNLNIRHF